MSKHILARRHKIDGVERIALHDSRSGALYLIAPIDWECLRRADGTASVSSIASSTGRAREALVGFFRDLAAEGILVEDTRDDVPTDLGRYVTPPPNELAGRRVEELPAFALSCDGAGECCAQYSSIVLTPDDVVRARAAGLGCLDAGAFTGDPLMPFSGPCADRVALPLVDGACAELTSRGRCGIHERGGAQAKPVACAAFPGTLVDDGDVVRSSVACECACVFRSADKAATATDTVLRTLRNWPAGLSVRVLPELVALTNGVFAHRQAVVAWSRRAIATDAADSVDRLLLEADLLRKQAREAVRAAGGRWDEPDIESRERLTRGVEAFAERMLAAAASADAWRSERDRTRMLRREVAEAAGRASKSILTYLGDSRWAPGELFFVRASIHGHAFVDSGLPLVEALERAAVWVVVARSLGGAAAHGDYPLAMVVAASRGMGA